MIPKFSVSISIEEKGKGAPKYRLEDDLEGEVTFQQLKDYCKRTLILVADAALKEEQAKGFDKNPVVAVDNKVGKPIEDVKPFGSIIFSARQAIGVVLRPIYERILEYSPVGEVNGGMYKEFNWVTLNGLMVASNQSDFEQWLRSKPVLKEGDIIRFVNVMPYAGKLERNRITRFTQGQKIKPRMQKARDKRQRSGAEVRVPSGTYALAARSVIRKYKFNSNIRFEWINGKSIDLSRVPTRSRRGYELRKTFYVNPKKGPTRTGSYVYPSIVVRINERGFLQ